MEWGGTGDPEGKSLGSRGEEGLACIEQISPSPPSSLLPRAHSGLRFCPLILTTRWWALSLARFPNEEIDAQRGEGTCLSGHSY